MQPDLETRFIRFAQQRRLVRAGERVLVAVSGGVDSVVLLHLFKQVAARLQVEVEAGHFDHGMRESSRADAEWAAGLCEAWGVKLYLGRSRTRLHGEAEARHARYRFLTATAAQTGAHRIATAHHADDQIETVLFRLLRGTGIAGLAGIPLRRGAIIRPLLRFHKAELEAYARAHQLAFRFDETNAGDQYARNRIRRALIPVMQTVNPAATHSILALARHAARTERAWRSVLETVQERVVLRSENRAIELARDTLLEYDAEIRARVLRAALRRFGVVPEKTLLRDLLRYVARARSGTRFDVNGSMRVERAYNVLRIMRAVADGPERSVQIDECGAGEAELVIGGRTSRVQWTTSPSENSAGASFDCAALQFPLELRGWRAGDRMRLAYGAKKLKKLFAEHRIPFNARASVPVLVDQTGRVLWVAGVARSQDAPARDGSPAISITVENVEIS